MKILYLLHAPFETPGIIERWATKKGYSQTYCSPYSGDIIPTPSTFDCIIAMGGPQSPLALDQAPYLRDEIELIRSALKAEIPVLGFCLGAQLIGEALGACTERSPFKEVGVYPITLTKYGRDDPLLANLPEQFLVSHWHNDMPGLTQESKILAQSAGCPRQIVRYTTLAYGFQCHPEMTIEIARDLVTHCPEDLAPGQYVQSPQEFLAHTFTGMNQNMVRILENFLAVLADQTSIPSL